MTREELRIFAKGHGFEVSVDQIERWHKAGIIPTPKRIHIPGRIGSISAYPEETKDQLLLALTVRGEAKSLDQLLLNVWYSGGKVSTDKLKKLLMVNYIIKLENFFKKRYTTRFNILESAWIKQKLNFKIPRVDSNDIFDSIVIALGVVSPHKNEHPWRKQLDVNMLDEKVPSETADQVFGSFYLRSLETQNRQHVETTEQMFDDMKKMLNISSLRQALEDADTDDFNRASKDIRATIITVSLIQELDVFQKPLNPFVRIVSSIMIRVIDVKAWTLLLLLRFYRDDKGRQYVEDYVSGVAENLEVYERLLDFVRYMKEHPKLKRRKDWNKYFEKCDAETLSGIRKHFENYTKVNPKFLEAINQSAEKRMSNATSSPH